MGLSIQCCNSITDTIFFRYWMLELLNKIINYFLYCFFSISIVPSVVSPQSSNLLRRLQINLLPISFYWLVVSVCLEIFCVLFWLYWMVFMCTTFFFFMLLAQSNVVTIHHYTKEQLKSKIKLIVSFLCSEDD